MVAVPVAMNAAALMELWWTWPVLAVGAWWWADRAYRSTWIVAIKAGAVGTGWAYTGTYNLGHLPALRLIVCVVWLGFAIALAASVVTRRPGQHLTGYRGY